MKKTGFPQQNIKHIFSRLDLTYKRRIDRLLPYQDKFLCSFAIRPYYVLLRQYCIYWKPTIQMLVVRSLRLPPLVIWLFEKAKYAIK